MTTTFQGFGEELPEFFEGLEADNSKAYWEAHRALYDEQVRGPLDALFADLAPEFGEGKVFRPYRDVRFSKDKSPYKTAAAGRATAPSGHATLYLQVDATGLLVAGGYYSMERDQLSRYRQAVDDDATGPVLVRAVNRLSKDGWTMAGHTLKRAPRGVDADHPRVDLLRHKGIAVSRHWPLEPWLLTPEVVGVVAEAWRALTPVTRWLDRHVGVAVPQATDRDGTR